eukprot:GILK01006641.1.p1 GENE.GILK01006641.1~~GILK01006641.1.p1  ORF type:complete len:703 (+),score=63.76 GILK01006641.1:168-2111(+)
MEDISLRCADIITVKSLALTLAGICLLAVDRVDGVELEHQPIDSPFTDRNLTFLHSDLDAFRFTATSMESQVPALNGDFVERAIRWRLPWQYKRKQFSTLQVLELCEMAIGLYRLWMSDGKWCFPVSLRIVRGGQLLQWLQSGQLRPLTVVSTNIPFRGEIDDVNNILIPIFDADTILGTLRHLKELGLKHFLSGRELKGSHHAEYEHVTSLTTVPGAVNWTPPSKDLCLSERMIDTLNKLNKYQCRGRSMSDILLDPSCGSELAMVLEDSDHLQEEVFPWPLFDAFAMYPAEESGDDDRARGMLWCLSTFLKSGGPVIHFDLDIPLAAVPLPTSSNSSHLAESGEVFVEAERRLRRRQEIVNRLHRMREVFESALLAPHLDTETKIETVEVMERLPLYLDEGCCARLIQLIRDAAEPNEWKGAILAYLAAVANRDAEVRQLLVRYFNDSNIKASVTFRTVVFTPLHVLEELSLIPAALDTIRRYLHDLELEGGVLFNFALSLVPRLTKLGVDGLTILLQHFSKFFSSPPSIRRLEAFLHKASIVPSAQSFSEQKFLSPLMYLLLRGIVRHPHARMRVACESLLERLGLTLSLEDMQRVVAQEDNWRRRRVIILPMLSASRFVAIDELFRRVRQLGPGLLRNVLLYL